MTISPEQCSEARRQLGWSRIRLGAKSMTSETTVRDFEHGRRIPSAAHLVNIQRALEAAGVIFQADGKMVAGGPGVRLKG